MKGYCSAGTGRGRLSRFPDLRLAFASKPGIGSNSIFIRRWYCSRNSSVGISLHPVWCTTATPFERSWKKASHSCRWTSIFPVEVNGCWSGLPPILIIFPPRAQISWYSGILVWPSRCLSWQINNLLCALAHLSTSTSFLMLTSICAASTTLKPTASR